MGKKFVRGEDTVERGRVYCTPLKPQELYEKESLLVLRSIAHIIAKKGYAPTIEYLAKAKAWHLRHVKRYVFDLGEARYLEAVTSNGWKLTEAGCDFLGIEYIQPIIPTGARLRAIAISEAVAMAKKLEDPTILAQFKAILTDRQIARISESENP